MISCVVVFDSRVIGVVYDETHQWLLGSSVEFRQTAVVRRGVEKFSSKLRISRRNGKIVLSCISVWDGTTDYIIVSRLLLVPVVNVCESIENWFQLIHPNYPGCSIAFWCLVYTTSKHLKWFVTTVLTLPTHVLQPHRILYRFSVMIQKQFFCAFQLFAPKVKHFYQ